MKRVYLTVSFLVPSGVKSTDCREYVYDAVSTWRGQLRPPGGYDVYDEGDPLWHLKSVKVGYRAADKK